MIFALYNKSYCNQLFQYLNACQIRFYTVLVLTILSSFTILSLVIFSNFSIGTKIEFQCPFFLLGCTDSQTMSWHFCLQSWVQVGHWMDSRGWLLREDLHRRTLKGFCGDILVCICLLIFDTKYRNCAVFMCFAVEIKSLWIFFCF